MNRKQSRKFEKQLKRMNVMKAIICDNYKKIGTCEPRVMFERTQVFHNYESIKNWYPKFRVHDFMDALENEKHIRVA